LAAALLKKAIKPAALFKASFTHLNRLIKTKYTSFGLKLSSCGLETPFTGTALPAPTTHGLSKKAVSSYSFSSSPDIFFSI